MVARGHTQIPGVDCTDNFSPVVSDESLRLVLVLWLIHKWSVWQLDIETAFLEGVLQENKRVHLKCPEGMELREDECLELHKAMCGLVQAARAFWKKWTRFLTSDKVQMK